MNRRTTLLSVPLVVFALSQSRADELTPKQRTAVEKGLAWLAKNQHRDGHWEAFGGQYPGPMTAFAGMALLGDGNTLREGRYAVNLQRATDFLLSRTQPGGLIGNLHLPTESGRYMYSHGLSLWFLSEVYGEVDDTDRRRKMEEVLTQAVKFSAAAQTTRGGWGYVSATDGGNFDEGAVAYVQVHSLFAARNAGIPVPRKVLDSAFDYLRKGQTAEGGLVYSLSAGGGDGRPTVSAEALAVALGTDMLDRETTKKLLQFVARSYPVDRPVKFDNSRDWIYSHVYVSLVASRLGADGHAKLDPESMPEQRLTWLRYRAAVFDALVELQKDDGTWDDRNLGPVFATACALMVLQRELQPVRWTPR